MRKLLLLVFLLPISVWAQTAVTPLMGIGQVQFSDSTGAPVVGGKLCTFAAGTTTPQNTFTDSTGVTPNTNPVILNSGGFAKVFISGLAYKLQLLTAGTDNTCSTGSTIWTVDGVQIQNLSAFLTLISGSCGTPATAGVIRLCNTDLINWRNTANTLNIGLSNAGAAATANGNVADVLRYGDGSHGALQAQRYIDFSAIPAQSGVVACGNTVTCVAARNAANSADIPALSVNASNNVVAGKVTLTQPATGSTITVADGKTLSANNSITLAGVDGKSLTLNNSLTFAGTDGTTHTFPNNTGTVAETNFAQTWSADQTSMGLVQPTIKTGISQGTGLKHQRFGASCTTTNVAFNSCSTTYTWSLAFADANYTVVCQGDGVTPNQGFLVLAGHTASQVTIQVTTVTATAINFGAVACIAIHD